MASLLLDFHLPCLSSSKPRSILVTESPIVLQASGILPFQQRSLGRGFFQFQPMLQWTFSFLPSEAGGIRIQSWEDRAWLELQRIMMMRMKVILIVKIANSLKKIANSFHLPILTSRNLELVTFNSTSFPAQQELELQKSWKHKCSKWLNDLARVKEL